MNYCKDITLNNYGWVCPKCGNVYAPHIPECYHCNTNKHINTTTTTSATAIGSEKGGEE